jgi:hypothetical protein
MTMRLAEEITIRIGHEAISLRPSLRAAYRLERRHNGFGSILRAIADGNLGMMADVINESTEDNCDLVALLSDTNALPFGLKLDVICEPLLQHVMALAGFDDKAPQDTPQAQRITFAEYHAKLFQIATGWLGWTPADAWHATPAEIIEAHKGRLDMLKAIFGSGEPDQVSDTSLPTPEQRRTGIATLQALARAPVGGSI